MSERVIQRFHRDELTEEMLQDAARLFSENYGIWGKPPTDGRSFGKAGE